jgi:hypothetical protein
MAADQNGVVSNGVKLLGEAFITPGSSLILDGRVGAGLLHGAIGWGAVALLGPIAGPIVRLLVAANSYSKSVSEQSLLDVMQDDHRAEGGRRSRTSHTTGSS